MSRPDGKSGSDIVVYATAAVAAAASVGYILVQGGFFSNSKPRRRHPYPPGPKGHFLFGGLFDVPDTSKGETYDAKNLENAKEYGLVYSVRVPLILGRLIVISDPELARKVLVTKNYPKSFFYKMLEPLVGPKSLVSIPTDKEWAGLRKAFNPGFAPGFLKGMVDTMASKLERFVAAIDNDIVEGRETNTLVRSQTFTSDVIVTVAFGEIFDWGGSKPHPARLLENEICRLYTVLITNPLRRMFDFPTKWRMRRVGVELEQEMRAILDRRLEAAAAAAAGTNGSEGENGGGGGGDFGSSRDIVSLAIAHLTKESGSGGKLTEDDRASIVDQLKTFYFAGHDTTATTIAWAVWELSQHPDVLAKVRSELKDHGVWTDLEVPPTYDQLQKCEYLEAVIKETLRLYPPASGITRYNADVTDTYKGYCIGGAVLMANAYVMHRHPQLWKRPDEFVPDRFLDGSESDLNSKFMPFSRGPRDCIGKYFALLEAKLAVSALAVRYELECVDPNDQMCYMLTNIPRDGAKIRFRRRQASE